MPENNLLKLVNPEISITLGDKQYQVRKANIRQVVAFRERLATLKGDPSVDQKIAAYCIYIMLKDKESTLTEDIVMETMPGDTDTMELLGQLGFMSPDKAEMAKRLLKTPSQ